MSEREIEKQWEKRWDSLTVADRKKLLGLLWQSEVIIDVEAERKWRQILPSSTNKLRELNWDGILGKRVQP